jgi:periplasmic copper chaperone A
MTFRMPESSSHFRYPAAGLTALGLVLAPAVAAQAHVHVHPDSTVAGSSSELTFTVPSESETASTTSLTVTLPQDHPFPRVSARATPGWTVKVVTQALPKPVVVDGTTLTKAAYTVTWTAQPGSGIPPEQYQNFDLKVGPLPDSGDVVLTAKQTYSDGSVVAWDQPTTEGAAEPVHPAPSFAVTPAEADTTAAEGAADATSDEKPLASPDGLARWLGGAGLLAGLAALGLAVARRSPRRPATRTATQTPADDTTLDVRAASGRPSV